mmetsp:Transcript_14984/g.26101  ORF Transcript_14984/g.26101 Transcript_14984/m.26101 type:complete len:116 (+) Transcript_14984:910-1257(+)
MQRRTAEAQVSQPERAFSGEHLNRKQKQSKLRQDRKSNLMHSERRADDALLYSQVVSFSFKLKIEKNHLRQARNIQGFQMPPKMQTRGRSRCDIHAARDTILCYLSENTWLDHCL